jgi:hypothetical protein
MHCGATLVVARQENATPGGNSAHDENTVPHENTVPNNNPILAEMGRPQEQAPTK